MNTKNKVCGMLPVALVALGLMSGVSAMAEDAECYMMAIRAESSVQVDPSESLTKQIAGTWATEGGKIVIGFNADGTCDYDSGKVKFTAWRIEGTDLVFTVESEGKQFDMPWQIDTAALDRGRLVLTNGSSVMTMTKKR